MSKKTGGVLLNNERQSKFDFERVSNETLLTFKNQNFENILKTILEIYLISKSVSKLQPLISTSLGCSDDTYSDTITHRDIDIDDFKTKNLYAFFLHN